MKTEDLSTRLQSMLLLPVPQGKFKELLEVCDHQGAILPACAPAVWEFDGHVEGRQDDTRAHTLQREPSLAQEGAAQAQAPELGATSALQSLPGPLEVHFAGRLDGITCQLVVEKGLAQCRIRTASASSRERMKRLGGHLARSLAQKGISLKGFLVTP